MDTWVLIKLPSFFFLGFHQFFPMLLFCSRSVVQGNYTAFSPCTSLDASGQWQVLRRSSFPMILTILGSTDHMFCKIFFRLDLSYIFLTSRLGLWVLGRKTTEVRYHFHHVTSSVHTNHITSRAHTVGRVYDCWWWPWSSGWGSGLGFTIKLLLPSWFFFCILWREVILCSPYLGCEDSV